MLSAQVTKKIAATQNVLLAAAVALIGYAQLLIFLKVPNEKIMGAVQRIFYFHVASATVCYIGIAILLLGSLGYLATRNKHYDALAEAAGEVSFIFCTITLVTGMIWGHAAWNTWFRWEPRLASFLLLWFILLSYNLLRIFGEQTKIAAHSAVLGVVSAVLVPIVIFSIKLLPAMERLHPEVVGNRGLKDPLFYQGMFVSMAALLVLLLLLISIRFRISLLRAAEE